MYLELASKTIEVLVALIHSAQHAMGIGPQVVSIGQVGKGDDLANGQVCGAVGQWLVHLEVVEIGISSLLAIHVVGEKSIAHTLESMHLVTQAQLLSHGLKILTVLAVAHGSQVFIVITMRPQPHLWGGKRFVHTDILHHVIETELVSALLTHYSHPIIRRIKQGKTCHVTFLERTGVQFHGHDRFWSYYSLR